MQWIADEGAARQRWGEREVDDALRPMVVAVDRAGTRVEEDVAWALLACEADRWRQKAQAERTRKAS